MLHTNFQIDPIKILENFNECILGGKSPCDADIGEKFFSLNVKLQKSFHIEFWASLKEQLF